MPPESRQLSVSICCRYKLQGLTLIELMVSLAILAVMASVAVPAISSSVARSELQTAQTTVTQALRQAKKIAKSRTTNVVVVFDNTTNQITLTLGNGDAIPPGPISLDKVSFADSGTYTFGPSGTVTTIIPLPADIKLTSDMKNTFTTTIQIVSSIGQIEVL